MGLLFSTVICWTLASIIGIKAAMALGKSEPYRWASWDGGLLMRGKETRPVIVLGVAAALALVPVIGWVWVLSLSH